MNHLFQEFACQQKGGKLIPLTRWWMDDIVWIENVRARGYTFATDFLLKHRWGRYT